jgi:hypothetical protein
VQNIWSMKRKSTEFKLSKNKKKTITNNVIQRTIRDIQQEGKTIDEESIKGLGIKIEGILESFILSNS